MKTGWRKFLGFIITIVFYSGILIAAMFKQSTIALDLGGFAFQASVGYCGIAGLFFAGNVAEHYANKGKGNEVN